jgi:hypothetical protein
LSFYFFLHSHGKNLEGVCRWNSTKIVTRLIFHTIFFSLIFFYLFYFVYHFYQVEMRWYCKNVIILNSYANDPLKTWNKSCIIYWKLNLKLLYTQSTIAWIAWVWASDGEINWHISFLCALHGCRRYLRCDFHFPILKYAPFKCRWRRYASFFSSIKIEMIFVNLMIYAHNQLLRELT